MPARAEPSTSVVEENAQPSAAAPRWIPAGAVAIAIAVYLALQARPIGAVVLAALRALVR
jgi:hypothetical protein